MLTSHLCGITNASGRHFDSSKTSPRKYLLLQEEDRAGAIEIEKDIFTCLRSASRKRVGGGGARAGASYPTSRLQPEAADGAGYHEQAAQKLEASALHTANMGLCPPSQKDATHISNTVDLCICYISLDCNTMSILTTSAFCNCSHSQKPHS